MNGELDANKLIYDYVTISVIQETDSPDWLENLDTGEEGITIE